MKTNQKDDLADLVKWTRGIEFHDEDDLCRGGRCQVMMRRLSPDAAYGVERGIVLSDFLGMPSLPDVRTKGGVT